LGRYPGNANNMTPTEEAHPMMVKNSPSLEVSVMRSSVYKFVELLVSHLHASLHQIRIIRLY